MDCNVGFIPLFFVTFIFLSYKKSQLNKKNLNYKTLAR